MAISIDLTDAEGNRIADARDVHDFVERVLLERPPKARVLGRVEPYDDLILEAADLDGFLEDWSEAERLVQSDHDRTTWDQVHQLADRARSERGLRLRFVAD
jgi:hypothetical protein